MTGGQFQQGQNTHLISTGRCINLGRCGSSQTCLIAFLFPKAPPCLNHSCPQTAGPCQDFWAVWGVTEASIHISAARTWMKWYTQKHHLVFSEQPWAPRDARHRTAECSAWRKPSRNVKQGVLRVKRSSFACFSPSTQCTEAWIFPETFPEASPKWSLLSSWLVVKI